MFNSFHFSGQLADEEVLHIVHRHWFNILQNFLSILLMVPLLFTGYIFLPLLFPDLRDGTLHQLFLFASTVFAMLIWVLFFLVWIDYYFDVWIITTKRIVDIEQKGLFSREVSEVRYAKIQDISTEVLGVLPTFLNYGNVLIQTAAEKEKFVFMQVPNPYQIKDIVMQLQKDHSHNLGEENQVEVQA